VKDVQCQLIVIGDIVYQEDLVSLETNGLIEVFQPFVASLNYPGKTITILILLDKLGGMLLQEE
jgi:hypothetical protein